VSYAFEPHEGLIVIPARLSGPAGELLVRLALDTGATGSLLNEDLIVLLGYDPSAAPSRVQITTGSGVETVPRLAIEKVEALGSERRQFPVVCHTLPPSASVDGLLGLDFFRGQRLVIDFRSGILDVD
jgi:predicted aspartyl protease